ncbi:MAG: hypothetical protein J3Q66DRAFT_359415 [Benniella sp.]|nr:MAG: hypothetical protein J3Q66DRAFT_359415 [Benniella sp.]
MTGGGRRRVILCPFCNPCWLALVLLLLLWLLKGRLQIKTHGILGSFATCSWSSFGSSMHPAFFLQQIRNILMLMIQRAVCKPPSKVYPLWLSTRHFPVHGSLADHKKKGGWEKKNACERSCGDQP